MNAPETQKSALTPRLTSLSHGGGCGCKIAPGVLTEILKNSSNLPGINLPPELLVGIETADDAAVYLLNEHQALIATTDFFMPIVDDPYDFGRIAATNAIGQDMCREAGIPIAGGHTIDSVEPIYGLVVMGLVHPSRIKKNSGAREGDVLVLGKPLGVGILSAALKNETLSAEGYAQMIAVTTQLNKPGIDLAAMPGVHALTDITGFGLAGHGLELARGAQLKMQINLSSVPLLPGVLALAEAGVVTGASGRNWDAFGAEITLPASITPGQQALLSDPQTSGGLLVSCTPECEADVLACFAKYGFADARTVGRMVAGSGVEVI